MSVTPTLLCSTGWQPVAGLLGRAPGGYGMAGSLRQGGVVGRVGWQQHDTRAMHLQSKEFSGVNIMGY